MGWGVKLVCEVGYDFKTLCVVCEPELLEGVHDCDCVSRSDCVAPRVLEIVYG